jgi:hypothetical protein
MALPIKRIQIIKPIEVADIKIIPDSDANVLTYLVLHDNLEISIEKELINIGTTYKLPPRKSNHTKLICNNLIVILIKGITSHLKTMGLTQINYEYTQRNSKKQV